MRPWQKRVRSFAKRIFPRNNPRKRRMSSSVRRAVRPRLRLRRSRRLPRRRVYRNRRSTTRYKRRRRFNNRVINAMISTQPRSIDIIANNFSIGSGASNPQQDKFFTLGVVYPKSQVDRIFAEIPLAQRAQENIWFGTYHLRSIVRNNSNSSCKVRMYKVFFQTDVDTDEIVDMNDPALWNQWVYQGFSQNNYTLSASGYRNIPVKFSGNITQFLRLRLARSRFLRPGGSMQVSMGSRKNRLHKYDRYDKSDANAFRGLTCAIMVQVTPTLGHGPISGEVPFALPTNNNQRLYTNAWRLDCEYMSHVYYKRVPNVTANVTQDVAYVAAGQYNTPLARVEPDRDYFPDNIVS